MAPFQWQMVDPARHEVERALGSACRAARRRPSRAERRQALLAAERSASGSVSWGDWPRRATCVWWSDRVGRRHWFVEGDQYRAAGEPNPLWRCHGAAVEHPLAVIDPLHVALRGQGAGTALLAVCDCGEVGTPEALGWMGDCCAPCFDRRAEGAGTTSRLAVHAHQTSVTGLAFTRSGRVVSVGYRDGVVHLHDPHTGLGTVLAEAVDRGGAGAAALPDGAVVVAFSRGDVICWDGSGEERWRMHCPGELVGLSASPAGDRLAVDAVDVSYLLTADGEEYDAVPDTSEFAFGPAGILYAYHSDVRGVVALAANESEWVETGLEFGEPEEDDCYSLACSGVRRLLAAGLNDGRVWIGDPKRGRWLREYERPASIVMSLAFTPDGTTLASAHQRTVLFWDVPAAAERGELTLPLSEALALAFSADGETLAVGDAHGVVRLWPWRRMLAARS
jgi:hypothetical protein